MNDAANGDDITGSHLDHDHSQRVDVCFLASASASAQDLWCGPSYGIGLANLYAGFQVRSDGCKAEVRNTRAACIVDKDAWLGHSSVRFGTACDFTLGQWFGIHAPLLGLHELRGGSGGT